MSDITPLPSLDHAYRGGPETFEALRSRIRARFETLSPHLQRIARSALEQPNEFALRTTVSIAAELGVQPSTLIRFAKEFDYSGFLEMQRIFRHRLIEGAADMREQVYATQAARPPADLSILLNGSIDALAASLEELRRTVSVSELSSAVSMLEAADHLYIAGLRRSRAIATYLAYGLARSERPCSLLDFGGGMASQQVANMKSTDLLVAIAFPPYSEPVVDVVVDCHLSGKPVLAFTDSPQSPLAKHAKLAFFVDNASTGQFRPISGAIALVQAMVSGLGRAEVRKAPS
ncbi:MurR/RpiR family transcriptional regulator [Aquibium oceanicum]|uniref:MurR/RpiR family transcriptional regulator n=1 Tax=Aquibium oceanicum TaxID=1670800 RepID=UPI000AA2B848|nr:MurR/RpiR family transcriptional regulator [Aquibium oceanicum]